MVADSTVQHSTIQYSTVPGVVADRKENLIILWSEESRSQSSRAGNKGVDVGESMQPVHPLQ